MFGCPGSSLQHGLFSICSEQGLLFSCSVRASHCSGFSGCRVQALGHTGFSSCSSQALEHRLSCPMACKIIVSGPEIEPMPPALAGGFLTTGPPGKSLDHEYLC